MPILEKIVKSEDAKHWADSIPLEFHYTAGVAGEEFLRELKDNGRLIASKCPKCKNSYVPPRMYCATCFGETKDPHNITSQGEVYSFAVVDRDRSGSTPPNRAVLALVQLEGAKGGLVQLLNVDSSK